MTAQLKHDASIHFDHETLSWEPYASGAYPAGLRARVLRRLDDGTPRSVVLDVPPGWSSGGFFVGEADEQGFVLSGDLAIGRHHLKRWGFYFHAAGSPYAPWSSAKGARLLLILGPRQHYAAVAPGPVKVSERAFVLADALAVQPITPVIAGKPMQGFERRVLFEDPDSGADTRLLRVPGGFEGRGPNWHPVHEEIFCLEGDIGPDDRRLLKPGWYLHNPAYGIHGYHEHSRGGATILEWHDGKWTINFV